MDESNTNSVLHVSHNDNATYENQILKNHLNKLNKYQPIDYSKSRNRKLVAIDEKVLEVAKKALEQFNNNEIKNFDDELSLEQWIDSSILLLSQRYLSTREIADLSRC